MARPAPGAPARHRDEYPSLTVIHPIRGVDVGLRDNLRAALDSDYPGELDFVFVLDHRFDHALPYVQRAMLWHFVRALPGCVRIIYSGAPPRSRTGKPHAMIAGLKVARGELVAFADSETRPARGTLTALVDTLLADPQAGCASVPVVVTPEPKTLGDAAYALMLNGFYAPVAAAAAARSKAGLPFVMGQMMVLRREAIAAIGGLEEASGQLVDDMYLGMRLHEAGFHNRIAPVPLPIIQQGLGFGDLARTYLRWLASSRSGLPLRHFKAALWLQGLVVLAGLALAVIALAAGAWPAALVAACVPVSVAASIDRLHRKMGGAPLPWRYAWVPLGIILGSPLALAWLLWNRQVEWRGRTYQLDRGSRLAGGAAHARKAAHAT